MKRIYHVAGYVKIAKLWEKKHSQAFTYHNEYYKQKYDNDDKMELVGVYIDITGNKHIYQRPEMIKLIIDCKNGKIDCIAAQTRGYLAPNLEEFCFMFSYLSEFNHEISIITEDNQYRINTVDNPEKQREELMNMSKKYISVKSEEYRRWKERVEKAIAKTTVSKAKEAK